MYMGGAPNMGYHAGMPHQMGYPPHARAIEGPPSPDMYQRGDMYNMMQYNDYTTSDMGHYPGPSQLQPGYHQMGYPAAYGANFVPMTHPAMYGQQVLPGHMQMYDGSSYLVPSHPSRT